RASSNGRCTPSACPGRSPARPCWTTPSPPCGSCSRASPPRTQARSPSTSHPCQGPGASTERPDGPRHTRATDTRPRLLSVAHDTCPSAVGVRLPASYLLVDLREQLLGVGLGLHGKLLEVVAQPVHLPADRVAPTRRQLGPDAVAPRPLVHRVGQTAHLGGVPRHRHVT